MQLREYITQTKEIFDQSGIYFGHGTDNALDESVYLIYTVLGIDYSQDFESSDRQLSAQELETLNGLVQRRIETREPVAYLVGEAWFCGRPYNCDARALVPRSPIAELIDNRFQPLLEKSPNTILDMCCGGGCIGIACALEFDQATVDLVDISEASLALARENIIRHGTSERVKTIQSNLFSEIDQRYDLIVANPPYVSSEEMSALPTEYQHEPKHGLECEDEGLALPLSILREAARCLAESGVLILEVGNNAERLQQRVGDVPLLWLDFEHGGHGVMAITAAEVEQYRERFD